MVLKKTNHVDFLILGAGWTSIFLIPQLKASNISYAATTTTGRDGTVEFKFDPDSEDYENFKALPSAKTILVTFPLKGRGQSPRLFHGYHVTHEAQNADDKPSWIQLGSTGIYQDAGWSDHTSPYNKENDRAIAEDEFLNLKSKSTVLNLAGLYDDEIRQPKNWVSRVAKSKQDVAAKTSLHLIHGVDVARVIVGAHLDFTKVGGQRWIVTDLFVYDWWALLLNWGGELQSGEDIRDVVRQCMNESGLRALPRPNESLGRALSSIELWNALGIAPSQGRAG